MDRPAFLERRPLFLSRSVYSTMSKLRLYTRQDKQIVLACFRAGLGPKSVANRLGFGYSTVHSWHEAYLNNDNTWAKFDDENYLLRQKALRLFKNGDGYKKVARILSQPVSRVKYWQLLYKREEIEFFHEGTRKPKQYDEDLKTAILNDFAITTDSKKAFCGKHKISVATLNKWLVAEKYKE